MSTHQLPAVIGITGRKYNGKDTVGNWLGLHHGYKRIAFADALKDACRCIFGFTDEQLYGSLKETPDAFWKASPRTILQYVGTNLLRDQLAQIIPHIGNDIWVNVVMKQMLDAWKTNPEQKFVITDVRFENEVKLISDLGGIMIRVKRDAINTTVDMHISELNIEKLKVDHEILNDGTVADLYEKIKSIV